jgi:molybdopterin/thiamine biosynthesis adenylyltransferase
VSSELCLTGEDAEEIRRHLFQGDRDEHAAIVLAGVDQRSAVTRLLGREIHLLGETEFIPGEHGYRQISAATLARLGNRAAEEGLALASCHSHPGATSTVELSGDDLAGHRRVFPHLLDIVDGKPVAGLAMGTESAAGELWPRSGAPSPLGGVRTIAEDLRLRTDTGVRSGGTADGRFDRQTRMFGAEGQEELRRLDVAVVGLGGGGSLICEQLAHLGVGSITAIDFDVVKEHNLSRIVGAELRDARESTKKVDVARRLATRIDPGVEFKAVDGDISERETAMLLTQTDFIFLATDSITSRHVANAISQAYFIPMVQIGAKVDLRRGGAIESVYVAVRPVFPGRGCLECAGLISPEALQREAASEEERQAQNYLDLPEVIDPSVISLNAVGAAAATNVMLMSVVGLARRELLGHQLFDARYGSWLPLEDPDRDPECPWCGSGALSQFGLGAAADLPVRLSAPTSEVDAEGPFHRILRALHLRRR